MSKTIRNLMVVTALAWSVNAMAQNTACMVEIKKIDEAVVKVEKSDPKRADAAKRLSIDAKKLAAEKKEAQCMSTVARAKALLDVA